MPVRIIQIGTGVTKCFTSPQDAYTSFQALVPSYNTLQQLSRLGLFPLDLVHWQNRFETLDSTYSTKLINGVPLTICLWKTSTTTLSRPILY